jgi:hypothetical protein
MNAPAARSILLGFALALTLWGAPSGSAQPAKGAWIIGAWEGQHSLPTLPEDATRFEFVADGDVIKWTMSRKGQIRLRNVGPDGRHVQNGEWQASGVVKKIAEGAVELEGKYDASTFTAVVGRTVTYDLKGTADTLAGHLVGARNFSVPISLKRVK